MSSEPVVPTCPAEILGAELLLVAPVLPRGDFFCGGLPAGGPVAGRLFPASPGVFTYVAVADIVDCLLTLFVGEFHQVLLRASDPPSNDYPRVLNLFEKD